MTGDAERRFVVGTARDVVAAVAPDEVVIFEPVSRAYLRDPGRVLSGRGRPGAGLGSGIDTVIALVTPVALGVASAVYQSLLDKTGTAVVERGGRLFRLLRRRADRGAPPEITADRLDALRALGVAEARRLGLSDEQAERVGDALRESLDRDL